jgi:hypothetical protein
MAVQVLKNKIQAPGFLKAMYDRNDYITGSYLFARWIGVPVPHIDPLKEVAAERAKLGKHGDNIPLTTVESATEHLNSGESISNIEQFSQEMQLAERSGIDLLPLAPEPMPAAEMSMSAMVIQSIIFFKKKFTLSQAKSWLSNHKKKIPAVDETQYSFRFRQREPSEFIEDSFRTIKIADGIRAVVGKLKRNKNNQ